METSSQQIFAVYTSLKQYATEDSGFILYYIWVFVYFLRFQTSPKCRTLAHRHVTTMCRTSVGFYVYRGRRHENNDIFYNCGHVHVCLDACCGDVTSGNGSDGRSVGRTQYWPTTTGWLAQWTDWPLRVGRWSQQAGTTLCCVSAKDSIGQIALYCLWSQPKGPYSLYTNNLWCEYKHKSK